MDIFCQNTYGSKFHGICSDRFLCVFLIKIDSPLLSFQFIFFFFDG